MFAKITYVEFFTTGTSISERTAFIKLLDQGNDIYHYQILHKNDVFLFDDNFKNKGFGLYVRPDNEHGFIVNNTLRNVEKLKRMIFKINPNADTDKYILNMLEHGFYSIDDLNYMLDEYSEELKKYLKINKSGIFVHCP